ncbi:MAG: 4Fe-4S cluster-binding domain-containing protein, partial [Lachnospiraceae bacterium]
DVLIDGEFISQQKDVMLHWRGSANQRVIDVPASKKQGNVVLHCQ